jgi:Tfp pilus assembly protein PilF
VGFWRKQVVDFALDRETRRHLDEQMAWIAREPSNPRPYYHLAQLYRTQGKTGEALALLLEAVSRDDTCADAHAALAEIYAVGEDYPAAWRHARAAEHHGNRGAVELLLRHGVAE